MNKKQIATIDHKLLSIEIALIAQDWLAANTRERKVYLHGVWMELELKLMRKENEKY